MTVRGTSAMIRGMAPRLVSGDVAFACVHELDVLPAEARALVREDEGVTLVLPLGHSLLADDALAMRQVTLTVHSALDGVGLTAAVAEALANAGIPCNVIAGYHHDHIYVPSKDAERAVDILTRRAQAG